MYVIYFLYMFKTLTLIINDVKRRAPVVRLVTGAHQRLVHNCLEERRKAKGIRKDFVVHHKRGGICKRKHDKR